MSDNERTPARQRLDKIMYERRHEETVTVACADVREVFDALVVAQTEVSILREQLANPALPENTPPTYVDVRGHHMAGNPLDQPHAKRLSDATWKNYAETVEVSCADVRLLLESYLEENSLACGRQREAERLQALLADDADWRRRADHEPLRSVVAVLLGARNPPSQELMSDETPYALAERVVQWLWDLRYALARERRRQHRIIVGKTGGLGLVDVHDPTHSSSSTTPK